MKSIGTKTKIKYTNKGGTPIGYTYPPEIGKYVLKEMEKQFKLLGRELSKGKDFCPFCKADLPRV